MLRNVYLKGIYKKSEDRNRKPLSLEISFLLIFGAFIVMLGTVIGPPGQEHKIWGTANEGVIHPGVGVPDGREISGWIDGVTYGNTLTVATTFDLYIDGDTWGVTADNNNKDGGYEGDAIVYFLDYNPMDYYLNVSHTTSSFDTSFNQHVDSMFFNRTDQAPELTTLRMLKINEIALDPDDGLPQYVIVYDPGQHLGMNNITDYYLQKDNNVTHTPDGETFDFPTHENDIVDMSDGYYYINLTSDLELNNTDELKLVWKSPFTPNIDPALTGPGNGTDIIVDRVEWGNYTNYINPVTPPDDRDYDNTTMLDFIDTASLYGTGASMVRTDDKFSPGYSGNGTDTDNCLADFKVLGKGTPRPQQLFYPIHNIDTDEYFDTIQAAIDDLDTLDGHTVEVAAGTYNENVVVSKTINLTGEDRETTIIDFKGGIDIIRFDADWINITEFTLNRNSTTGSGAGISVYRRQNCTIDSVSINNTMFGIKVNRGNNSIINGVNLTNNDNGIWIVDSADSVISDCLGLNNTVAIYLVTSYNVTLINNTMINDGIKVSGSKPSDYCSHNIDTTNTVNGKPIYYWRDINNKTVPTGAGQVIIANSTDIVIEKQNITDVSWAISVYFSAYIHIRNNSASYNSKDGLDLYRTNDSCVDNNRFISNNDIGISLAYANNNTITNNTIESSGWRGINVWWSHNNKIISNNISYNSDYGILITQLSSNNYYYHNNFIDNIEQINELADDKNFDDSYPSGGNFWSDYAGIDNFRGPGQNIPGGDGIGDTPYPINSGEEDNYPLMEPYYPIPENSIILLEGWNLISIPFIQQEQDVNNVLETIDSRYDAIQWYDNSNANNLWEHHKVGKPFGNDLQELNKTKSFWIHISAPGRTIFVYNGTQPTSNQSITLHPGWNMVGYPSLSNRNRTAALNNINYGTDVDAIWTFIAATQTWQEIGSSDYFELGRGYWIHSKVTKVWDVPL